MKIEIIPISENNKEVLALPNEPFLNTGRLIPKFDGNNWSYELREFPEEMITEDCFPDENYVYEEMWEDFYGFCAIVDGEYVGFALYRKDYKHYLYLDNLLIVSRARGKGIGSALVDAGMKLARDLNLLGVWTVCQDNNLLAAKFYVKNGFELGGIDMRAYEGSKKPNMADLYFYKKE